MLIDNKVNRFEDQNIVTVWDFINTYSGKESGEHGRLDIGKQNFKLFHACVTI